jgi:hypothetical protein
VIFFDSTLGRRLDEALTKEGEGSQRNMERLGFRVAYTQIMMVRDRVLVPASERC